MLSNTLNTNEVKNSSGTEVELQSLSIAARTRIFAKISEVPSLPHRLTISHQETGSGLKQRRRSVCRVDITTISDVDTVTPVTTSAYIVVDAPIGASATLTNVKDALAELTSFVATQASTTLLYDGTGNGAAALISGGL